MGLQGPLVPQQVERNGGQAPGVLLWCGVAFYMIRHLVRCVTHYERAGEKALRFLSLGCLGAMVGAFVTSIFQESSLGPQTSSILFLFTGIVSSQGGRRTSNRLSQWSA